MKFAVCTLAYNEAEYIEACIENWKGVVDKHLVLITMRPWNGEAVEDDGTYTKAVRGGAEVIMGTWRTEAEQRSWGLAKLYDYDYVLIVDADEFYTKEDQAKIIQALSKPIDPSFRTDRPIPAFRCARMATYWKNSDYVFEPADRHKPIIAVDPKRLLCYEHRQFKDMIDGADRIEYAPMIDVTCHHMSWAKSNEKVREKIESFSHADIILPGWYHNVWLAWQPGSDLHVRPYGLEQSVAVYKPAPQEIKDLIKI